MITFLIISSLMVTSPVWVLGYDYLNYPDSESQDDHDEQGWWF